MLLPENHTGLTTTHRRTTASLPRVDIKDRVVTGHSNRAMMRAAEPVESDETLVVDARSGVTPAEMVEHKLTRILKNASLPVSHLQMRGILRSR